MVSHFETRNPVDRLEWREVRHCVRVGAGRRPESSRGRSFSSVGVACPSATRRNGTLGGQRLRSQSCYVRRRTGGPPLPATLFPACKTLNFTPFGTGYQFFSRDSARHSLTVDQHDYERHVTGTLSPPSFTVLRPSPPLPQGKCRPPRAFPCTG